MITHKFKLNETFNSDLKLKKENFGFGIFGEVVYYRTYSRNGERWADTIIRVIDGIMSIRKNYCVNNKLAWDEIHMQEFAEGMATYMFNMKFLPAGRSLWAQGTPYICERGSAALLNCGAVTTTNLEDAVDWTMDMLMCGCGIGFDTEWKGGEIYIIKNQGEVFVIPDSREGWVQSIYLHVKSYTKGTTAYTYDFSKIRPAGQPLRGFGGTSSGPESLKTLHLQIDDIFHKYNSGCFDNTRLVVDIMNVIGCCVVSGNIRRSAMLALGDINDRTFLNLKNYEVFPDRADIGWISNNSVVLKQSDDFLKLKSIIPHIQLNGEPGIINLMNIQKFGRVRYGEEKRDNAFLINPCGEEPLENRETCNLAEVFPTKCANTDEFHVALKYATFYTSTVALLPTHREDTNKILFRNRRIGVSLSGITDWLHNIGCCQMIRELRDGYKVVQSYNQQLAKEAGIPVSIRLTTIKPSGTISLMAGVSSGMNYPHFKYAIRRIRIATNSQLYKVLCDANIPNEPDVCSKYTTVFEFPIDQGNSRKASEVSIWEQFSLLATLQREWSDSAVSSTLTFNPITEKSQLEHVLSQFIPIIKTVALLPRTTTTIYKQMPYEEITKKEYRRRVAAITTIDWSSFSDSDGIDEKYCSNDTCFV